MRRQAHRRSTRSACRTALRCRHAQVRSPPAASPWNLISLTPNRSVSLEHDRSRSTPHTHIHTALSLCVCVYCRCKWLLQEIGNPRPLEIYKQPDDGGHRVAVHQQRYVGTAAVGASPRAADGILRAKESLSDVLARLLHIQPADR